ncbi:MAG: nucleotidyltransferase domain-containing protein [Asgard group archaeon]|nr:nucleotidyltransferase domain-containing protein [Asgard group archaeon]
MTSDDLAIAKKVADILVSKTNTIDLVLLYGSIAQGKGHQYSDFDMIIVSDKEKIVWEFILNNRPIAAWSTTWKHIENVMLGKESLWSVSVTAYTHAQILYSKSKEYEKRFKDLFSKTKEGSINTIKSSIKNYGAIFSKFWLLEEYISQDKLVNTPSLRWHVANSLVHILSALNNQPLFNNWGKQREEISKMKILPKDFVKRYEKFLTVEPHKCVEIGKDLVKDVTELVNEWIDENDKETKETPKNIALEWSGIIEYLNKIRSARLKKDLIACKFASTNIGEYVLWAYMILRKEKYDIWEFADFHPVDETINKLPKRIQKDVETLLLSDDFDELLEAAKNITIDLKEELINKGIEIPTTTTLQDAEKFMQISKL